MNRFIIDEDAGHEIIKFYEVTKLYSRMLLGMGHIIFLDF